MVVTKLSRFPNVEVLAKDFYDGLVKTVKLSGGTFEEFKENLSLWAFPQMKLTPSGMVRLNMIILGFEPIKAYCVYANNRMIYIVFNPSDKFFFDLEHRFMTNYQDAMIRYFRKDE